MKDLVLSFCWISLLAIALYGCVSLSRAGVKTTYVRDLLHVGAGV